MLRDVPPRNAPPPEIRVGEEFTSGMFCLQYKHPACECFLTQFFYREGLLPPRQTPTLEDHPSSAIRDCLFNLLSATLLIGGISSICNLMTHHAVVCQLFNFTIKLLLCNNRYLFIVHKRHATKKNNTGSIVLVSLHQLLHECTTMSN